MESAQELAEWPGDDFQLDAHRAGKKSSEINLETDQLATAARGVERRLVARHADTQLAALHHSVESR